MYRTFWGKIVMTRNRRNVFLHVNKYLKKKANFLKKTSDQPFSVRGKTLKIKTKNLKTLKYPKIKIESNEKK